MVWWWSQVAAYPLVLVLGKCRAQGNPVVVIPCCFIPIGFSLIQMQCLGSYGVVMPCCFVSIALMSVTKAMKLWWCLFACGPVITQLRGRHPPCSDIFQNHLWYLLLHYHLWYFAYQLSVQVGYVLIFWILASFTLHPVTFNFVNDKESGFGKEGRENMIRELFDIHEKNTDRLYFGPFAAKLSSW